MCIRDSLSTAESTALFEPEVKKSTALLDSGEFTFDTFVVGVLMPDGVQPDIDYSNGLVEDVYKRQASLQRDDAQGRFEGRTH